MKTLFFGTPDFAVPTLAAMVEAGYAPLRVITQPARPVGRKRQLRQPPVAQWARGQGLEVLQPEKVNRKEFLEPLRALEPDVAVVVAFGQIFRRRLLELPRHGCVNLHASLLPRWRGAAPIQAAVAHGEPVTGVTAMRMEAGLDSGPILRTAELEIGADETAAELSPRLAALGARLIVETLGELEHGPLEGTVQDGSLATYAPRLGKEDGQLDWRRSAGEVYNLWRAYTPWPGVSTSWRGRAVKLLELRPLLGEEAASADAGRGEVLLPAIAGGVRGVEEEGLRVACGDGTIVAVERLQLAGKKPISAADFVNGEQPAAGEAFASHQVASKG